MKKLVFVALIVALVTGMAFAADAEVHVSGTATADFGISADLGVDKDQGPDRDAEAAWIFRPNDAIIEVHAEAGAVSATVKLNKGGLDKVDASVDLDPLTLSVGYYYLPWVQWSALDVFGDSNYGIGASALKDLYIQAKYSADPVTIYGGIFNAGVNGDPFGVDGPIMKDDAVFPGFYIGGDFDGDGINIGAAFYGVPRGKYWEGGDKTRFSWMGNVHANFNFEPITVGVNLALYGDPGAGSSGLAIFHGVPIWELAHDLHALGKDDVLFEAMASLGVDAGPGTLGFSIGILTNVAKADTDSLTGGMASMKLGLCYGFDIGGGFSIIPGIVVNLALSEPDGEKPYEKGTLDIGLTCGWSF